MNKFEDFVIDSPYQNTESDKEGIAKASPNGNHKEDWASNHLDDYKKHLRDYLREKQHSRCAYCRLRIHENEATAEIEHIVPKDKKPEWMYDAFNLCLSCKLCNTKKGHVKKIIVDDNVVSLPKDSKSYLLIHPYLDHYSEHIEFVEKVLYKGLTEKGRYTIKLCNLNRYELAVERADQAIIHDASSYGGLMLALVDENHKILVDKVDRLMEGIRKRIKEYKELNGIN